MKKTNFNRMTNPAGTERDWIEGKSRVSRGNSRLYSFLPCTLIVLFTLLTLGVGQMWGGNTYKITGNGPGWGTWVDMTVSSDGYYEYYTSSSGNCECKINTSATYENAYGEYYRDNGFNGTDIANGKGGTWTDDNHNANYWYHGGSYYLIIYYANTSINTTSSPKICASTFLPDDSPAGPSVSLGASPTSAMCGEDITFTATPADLGGASATYKFEDITSSATTIQAASSTTTCTHSWTTAGTKTVRVTMATGGNNYTATKNVTVKTCHVRGSVIDDSWSPAAMTYATDAAGDAYYYCKISKTGAFKVLVGNSDWNPADDGHQKNFDNVNNSRAGADIILTEGDENSNIDIGSTGYIIYYPDDEEICATSDRSKLGVVSSKSVAITSVSPTSLNSGGDVTIVATPTNTTNTITLEYTDDSGANWHSLTPKSSSLSSYVLTATWTIPVGHGDTKTYNFRAKVVADEITSSASSNVKAYGIKTIKVKDTNGWGANFKIHRWGGDAGETTYPGVTTNITSAGGQWKQVVLYSSNSGFLFCNGVDKTTADNAKTVDISYSNDVEDDGCYVIGSPASGSTSFTEGDCPSAPTSVTTSEDAPTSVTNEKMTVAGSIGGNGNDNITDYGFYYGTTSTPGTKAQVGTSDKTGSISKEITGLTAGTTYYFKAYATNGQGTSYGGVESYKLPYKVTVNSNTGCTSITNSGTNYTNSTIEVTATKTTGYTFSSWSTTNGTQTSTSSTSTTNTLEFTPTSDNATISPTYTENSYSTNVAVSPTGKGSISSPTPSEGKISVKQVTGTSVTASANTNYVFTGWSFTGGGIELKSPSTSASNPATFTATSTGGTITANFADQWNVKGSWDSWVAYKGMPATGVANTYSITVTLAANTSYTFKVVKRANAGEDDVWYTKASTTFSRGGTTSVTGLTTGGTGNEMTISADAAGDYTITYTYDASASNMQVAVGFPTAYTVTFGAKYANINQIYTAAVAGTTGGTITAVDQTSASLTSGNKVKSGGDVTFTATPATGYNWGTFAPNGKPQAWFMDAALSHLYLGGFNADSTEMSLSGLSKDTAAYVVFKENATKVIFGRETGGEPKYNGHIQYWNGSSWENNDTYRTTGITTHSKIKAVPNEGYYFKEWKKKGTHITLRNAADNADVSGGEADSIVCLKSDGTASTEGDTLIAVFEPLEEIYFYNSELINGGAWSDVYVYFGVTWNGYENAVTNPRADYRVKMSGDLVCMAYVPHSFTTSNSTAIAFADYAVAPNTAINSSGKKAATRNDYNKLLQMYIPSTESVAHGADYYNGGYWWSEPARTKAHAGYWLKNKKESATLDSAFIFPYNYSDNIELTLRIDAANTDTTFYLVSAGGLYYKTHNVYTDKDTTYQPDTRLVTLAESSTGGIAMHTSSEGDYVFRISKGIGHMTLQIEYPVSVGDYRLQHIYNDGGKDTTYSDVIKASKADQEKRLSMYFNKNGSPTLTLQRCTSTAGGNPVFENVSADNSAVLNTILSKVSSDGNGVYQFDVTNINTTSHVISINTDSTRLYKGDFYIKTDCAAGGWSRYTYNPMSVNTLNPTAFDYYYCRWIGNMTTNVKCVIANDYCNQISDTLASDAILYRNSKWYETLPEAANVRFSYNSKTNVLERTYLKGSTLSENFVSLVPAEAGYVYSAKTEGTDYYSSQPKFADNGNWTYQMDAYVYPGAKGGVKTSYPSVAPITIQELVDTTDNVLMGGTTKGSTRYHVRLLYDFKTDYLMSAYMPDGEEITTAIDLNTDMLYIRKGTDHGTQLSFSGSGELKNVKHAYGVIEFPKDTMYLQMSTWSENAYRAYKFCRYYFSFPFNVKVSDIFGVGTMGTDWIIEKYNGAKRAEYGWFAETNTFWERVAITDTLFANVGYSLSLDRSNFAWDYGAWTNIPDGGSTFLYFPSMSSNIGDISATSGTHTIPELLCTIDREFSGKSHKNTESNWTLFGVPAYADIQLSDEKLNACYIYNPEGNTWVLDDNLASTKPVFKSMHAYMVQWAGTFSWVQYTTPAASAPARNAERASKTVHLEMIYDGKGIDRTYVRLKEGTNAGFMLNEDGYKLINNNQSNIYAFAGAYEVGMSQVPEESQTVPVGVIIRKKGVYTFSMPENFDGTVILVDKFEGTRTNLSQEDYEIELPKGTINDRFELEIDINKLPTSVEGVSGDLLKANKAYKFFENGNLFIMENDRIYDARGNRVK